MSMAFSGYHEEAGLPGLGFMLRGNRRCHWEDTAGALSASSSNVGVHFIFQGLLPHVQPACSS